MDPSRAFLDGVLKYKSTWGDLGKAGGKAPANHFVYDEQNRYVCWALGEQEFPPELAPGKVRDGFKSVECQVMDWADDTAYSLNDIVDGTNAGFINLEKLEH